MEGSLRRLRQTGIRGLGEAPWGTHFCQFYATPEDLTETLVPYFKAGLEAGEMCMWVTSPPLGAQQAWAALSAAVPDLEDYRRRGRIEILPHTEWYLLGGTFDQKRVLDGWISRLAGALRRGCEGLRLTGNTFWLEKKDWRTFEAYEAEVDAVLHEHRMLALCTYSLDRCDAGEIADVIKNHEFALVKRHGRWEIIESSDRRRLKEAHAREIAVERERLATTLQSIGDGVVATDTSGRIVTLNRAAERLTGWMEEQARGRRFDDVLQFVDEGTGQPVEDPVGQVLRSGTLAALARHTALISRDGTWFSVQDTAAPIHDGRGETNGVVVVFRDVTATRLSERRLRESEERYRLLFEALRVREARGRLLSRTASQLLAAQDPQTVVSELCLGVMEQLDCHLFLNFLVEPSGHGLRLHACAGVPPEEIQEIETLDFGAAICGRVARDGRSIVAEDIQATNDPAAGLVRSYGVQAYCCHPLLAGGKVLGTLSFGTRTRTFFTAEDVELMRTVADQVATAMERIEARQALSAANARLVEADRRKNEFLAVLSHELRNPLAPIKNGLYILDRAAPGGEQARRALRVIDRQVTQLADLVNDLLDITRITSNKIRLQTERLELNAAVRRAVEDNRSLFDHTGLRLELAPTPGPVHVEADPTRLAQIVGNLLQNSAKFGCDGGTTRVSIELTDGAAAVSVADDGVGLSPDTLLHLFQPFMQAEQTLDRSKGGLGLGLALVKGLVELHGGSITAHSEGLGKGAEFVVRLPTVRDSQLDAAACAPAATARSPRRRVLIIEDNTDAAESLRAALELGEHQVAVASDGPQGIAKARDFDPEVVLCDIGLPGMDGYEVARAFRADERLSRSTLIAVSGYALPDDLERAARAGFARHLTKPASLQAVEELLASLS